MNKKIVILLIVLLSVVFLAVGFVACQSQNKDHTVYFPPKDNDGGNTNPPVDSGDQSNELSGYFVVDGIGYDIAYDLASVSKMVDYKRENITIPSEVIIEGKNYPVIRIKDNALQYLQCKSIVISEGIKEIGDKAFLGNSNMQNITIPKSVNSIGEKAFENCSELEEVAIPESVKFYGEQIFAGCDDLQLLDLPYIESLAELFGSGNVPSTLKKIIVQCGNIGDYFLGSSSRIEEIVLEDGVSDIESGAFYNATYLKKIHISGSVKSIGDNAFDKCTNLSEVIIEEGVEAIGNRVFDNCPALKTLILPKSLKSINRIIQEGTYLEKLALPYIGNSREGNTFLSDIVFRQTMLTELTVTDAQQIGDNALSYSDVKKVKLNEGITYLGEGAFLRCAQLTEVNIPSTVKEIGANAFNNCRNLEYLNIPAGVEKIGNNILNREDNCIVKTPLMQKGETWADNWCESKLIIWNSDSNSLTEEGYAVAEDDEFMYLVKDGKAKVLRAKSTNLFDSYIIPDSVSHDNNDYIVEEIADYAFKYKEVQGIQLSNNIKVIGNGAISYCKNLKLITMPAVEKIGNIAFLDCEALQQINLPDTLKELGTSVFAGCTSLHRINIPGSLKILSEYTFSGCEALKDVSIDEGIEVIDFSAFAGCDSLLEIKLPQSLTRLNSNVFRGCIALEYITIPANVTILNSTLFYGCTNLKSITFEDASGWKSSFSGEAMDFSDPYANIQYFERINTEWYQKSV